MTNEPDFFNVKINVNGKVHNVKIEKGVNLSTSEGILSVFGDNQIDKVDRVDGYTYKYGGQVSQLNMSEAEFSIFKNVADNVQENGDSIVLSKKDVEEAEALFRQGEFTKDISKNLPDGYKAERSEQDLDTRVAYNFGNSYYWDDKMDHPINIAGVLTNKTDGSYSSVNFRSNHKYSESLIEFTKAHPDYEVALDAYGEDNVIEYEGFTYVDKNRILYEVDGATLEERPFGYRYDEDGKHIEGRYEYDYNEDGSIKGISCDTKTVSWDTQQGFNEEKYVNGVLTEYREYKADEYGIRFDCIYSKEYKNGKLSYESKNGIYKYYDDNEKISKIKVKKDGYDYEYDVKKDKLTISKDYKKVLEKQGDKTTHYIDGMTWDEYIMKDLRGEIK